jgi:hypothetical protein
MKKSNNTCAFELIPIQIRLKDEDRIRIQSTGSEAPLYLYSMVFSSKLCFTSSVTFAKRNAQHCSKIPAPDPNPFHGNNGITLSHVATICTVSFISSKEIKGGPCLKLFNMGKLRYMLHVFISMEHSNEWRTCTGPGS